MKSVLIHARVKSLLAPRPTVGHPQPNVKDVMGAAHSLGVQWPRPEAERSIHPVSRIRFIGTLRQHIYIHTRIHNLHRPDFTLTLPFYNRRVFQLVIFWATGSQIRFFQ